MATITINGQLILDQTAGLQADDVDVTSTGGTLAGLDSDFMTFLNSLGLSAAQKNFAAFVDGASEPNLVSVAPAAGETVKSLFFSDASGNDLDGDTVPGVTLLDGSPLYMWSADNGHVVLISTSNVAPDAGTIAAAFYIESNNAANTSAEVQSITFMPLLHPDATSPNDPVDFSDILNVSATVVASTPVGDDIIVLDDGPTINATDDSVSITVDETVLATNNSASFAGEFTKDFGTDGVGTDAQYSLTTLGGASGLIDTATGEAVNLVQVGATVEGRTAIGGLTVFVVSVDGSGSVTLDQQRAIVHPNALDPNDSKTLASDDLISLHATITDGDGDAASAVLNIGQNLNFLDDGPHISPNGTPPTATVDETNLGVAGHADYGPLFTKDYGADGGTAIDFSLDFGIGPVGLVDSETGEAISLSKAGGVISGKNTDGDLMFTISVSAAGDVVFTQFRSVTHDPDSGPDQTALFASAGLITLTATITDGDGDQASTTLDIGKTFAIKDDAPTLTVPVDYPGTDTFLKVGNAAGQHATGSFGYNIGADDHTAAFYAAGGSDFVDSNSTEAGVQIALTGSVSGPPSSAIFNTDVTLVAGSETAHAATFNWSFHYDGDPLAAGVQDTVASGTLVFDKDADTFTFTDTVPVIGFSQTIFHTSNLLSKEPTSNVGHPNIVDETLVNPDGTGHNGFVVQFTGDNSPFGFSSNGQGGDTGDHTFTGSAHDMVGGSPTWVSATQSTNGVAGDTIQKGEALTLRFFDHSPGIATEATQPSAVADGVAVKFDGIGNSETLIVNLDLINFGADGHFGGGDDTSITRSVVVDNADIYKTGQVPAAYGGAGGFTLDNNDGLVIIEHNDYNFAGENFHIEGLQIMQSANGLTGSGINLNRDVGASGGSPATPLESWGVTDNDVLKITDIGFLQTTTGTQTASMDFAFNISDGDMDLLGVQHIAAQLSNGFIV